MCFFLRSFGSSHKPSDKRKNKKPTEHNVNKKHKWTVSVEFKGSRLILIEFKRKKKETLKKKKIAPTASSVLILVSFITDWQHAGAPLVRSLVRSLLAARSFAPSPSTRDGS